MVPREQPGPLLVGYSQAIEPEPSHPALHVHGGERIDFITAPAGSGKTEAIRAWLDTAGDAADQIWLEAVRNETLDQLPKSPLRPTFVVINDYEPDPQSDRAIIDLVRNTSQTLHFVIATRPPRLYTLIRLRLGTRSLRSPPGRSR